MRKRIFLAVSTSDLATRKRIFFPPCRIRSTALKAGQGRRVVWPTRHGSSRGVRGAPRAPGLGTPPPRPRGAPLGLPCCQRPKSGLGAEPARSLV